MDDVIVRGWMTERERMALRRWAFGLKVLEIGAYEGLSTMALAVTAEHVTTIDTFDGRGTNEPKDTEATFHANMRACGLSQKVLPIKGESTRVMEKLESNFDMVFIDGSHDYDSVLADALMARKLLKPDGFLAFHDYGIEHPGVAKVVDWLAADGMACVDQADSAVLLKNGPKPEQKPAKVALMMPTYRGWTMHGGILQHGARCNHVSYVGGTSIITSTFNQLLCDVMNAQETENFTHLAMIHDDVVPDSRWLDVAVAELEVGRYDMLSAVIPIKDKRGVTSTGLQTIGTNWGVRRLTLAEVYDLPETFVAEDVPWRQEGQGLLLNSGLWVMKFKRPWFQGLHFRQQNRIKHLVSGKWGHESISEDWDFSRQLLDRGCRLAATRKIGLHHERHEFHNRSAWGEWTRDEDFLSECDVIEKAKELATV